VVNVTLAQDPYRQRSSRKASGYRIHKHAPELQSFDDPSSTATIER
jgi:hypothetical protein